MTDLSSSLADGALASDNTVVAFSLGVTTHGTASEAYATVLTPGGSLAANGHGSDTWTIATFKATLTYAETGKGRDAWSIFGTKSLAENGHASEVYSPRASPRMAAKGKASETYTVSVASTVSFSSNGKGSESYKTGVAASFAGHGTASEQYSTVTVASLALSERAQGTEAYTPIRGVPLTITQNGVGSDSFQVLVNAVVQMNELGYASTFVLPKGSSTSWAMNTRTNAVTEYRNVNFNSAVNIGRKYIAANETGLYELDGPTDEGNVPVVSRLDGGYFQANGGKTAGLKGVYLGAGGQGPASAHGNWGLTITMGDGNEYVYAAPSNPGLMTSKFNMGKGLHARYIAWSLTNLDGQDFDLDTLEFVPSMSGRRVG